MLADPLLKVSLHLPLSFLFPLPSSSHSPYNRPGPHRSFLVLYSHKFIFPKLTYCKAQQRNICSKWPIAYSFVMCVCVCVWSVMSDSFVTPWTVAHQAPLSMGFPRHEYWSALWLLLQGSSWPRDWTHVSCTAGRFFTTAPSGKPRGI